jgi:hypothetical protein
MAPLGAISVYGFLLLIDPFDGWRAPLAVLAFVAVASYVAETVALLPFLFLRRPLDQIGLGSHLVGGFVMGTITALALEPVSLHYFRWKFYAGCAVAGTASAAVFWIVLTRRK